MPASIAERYVRLVRASTPSCRGSSTPTPGRRRGRRPRAIRPGSTARRRSWGFAGLDALDDLARARYLHGQLVAARTALRMVEAAARGERIPHAEEVEGLFGIVPRRAGGDVRRGAPRARRRARRHGPARRAARGAARAARRPRRAAARRARGRDGGAARAQPGARRAARRRVVRLGGRARAAVARLQLVPGRPSLAQRGERRPAVAPPRAAGHRRPRGLSGTPPRAHHEGGRADRARASPRR